MRPDFGPRAWAGVALIALTACGGAGGDVVARVGDQRITVDDVAGYMQDSGYGANEAEVEKAVDELVDLTLVSLRGRERLEMTAGDSLQISEWGDQLLYN